MNLQFVREKPTVIALVALLGMYGCQSSESESTQESSSDTGSVEDDAAPLPEHDFSETVEPEGSTFYPEHVLDVQVTMAPEDWETLRFERRSAVTILGSNCDEPIPDSYNYYPADVAIDGELLEQVGVRAKGFVGSINPGRPSLKVKLQEYQDDFFYKEQKRFTFNNQSTDATRVATCMAYYIFRKMGVPASRCNFAHVSANELDMGVYANVEPIKKPMLQRLFGDDSGNLYEGTVSDLRTGFTARLEKKTNEEEDDWSDVERLIAAIEAPDDVFIEKISEVVDIDAFIRFSAVSIMVGHWDSFSGNANNYYTYHDPTTDKFYFIPWGPDDTFSSTGELSNGQVQSAFGGSMLARRLFEHPEIRTRYRDTMRSMLNDLWNDEEILAELDRMQALLTPHVMNLSPDEYAAMLDATREFLMSRKQTLINAVNADPPPFSGELPTEPMCLEPVGTMLIEFEGTWGTLGADDPFAGGSGSMNATYGDFNFNSLQLGPMMGEPGAPGGTEMFLIGLVSPSQALAVRLSLPTSMIQPGNIVDSLDSRIGTLLILIDFATMDPQVMGFLGEGEIRFGHGSNPVPGGLVSASVDAVIWGGRP
jgi:spore coat protein CotH